MYLQCKHFGASVGDTFTVGELTYRVTDATKNYIEIVGCDISISGILEIPSALRYNRTTYYVKRNRIGCV